MGSLNSSSCGELALFNKVCFTRILFTMNINITISLLFKNICHPYLEGKYLPPQPSRKKKKKCDTQTDTHSVMYTKISGPYRSLKTLAPAESLFPLLGIMFASLTSSSSSTTNSNIKCLSPPLPLSMNVCPPSPYGVKMIVLFLV